MKALTVVCLLILVTSVKALGQYNDGGREKVYPLAAVHRYSEDEGVKDFNHHFVAISRNGRIVFSAYGSRDLYLIGANWNMQIPLRLEAPPMALFFNQGDTLVIANDSALYLIAPDFSYRRFAAPCALQGAMRIGNGVLLSRRHDSAFHDLLFFDGTTYRHLDWSRYRPADDAWGSWLDERSYCGPSGKAVIWYTPTATYAATVNPHTLMPEGTFFHRLTVANRPYPELIQFNSTKRYLFADPYHMRAAYVFDSGKALRSLRSSSPIRMTNDSALPVVLHEHGVLYRIMNPYNADAKPLWFESSDVVGAFSYKDPNYSSRIIPTGNKPRRLFPWLRQYPRIFHGSNSGAIFSLAQDTEGRIWAGSYSGDLSIVTDSVVEKVPKCDAIWMNGGAPVGDRLCMIGEGSGGLFLFDSRKQPRKISWTSTAFYCYKSRDGRFVYFGKASSEGIWRTTVGKLISGSPEWEKYGSGQGVLFENILTLTEDRKGRIWFGREGDGVGVLDVAKGIGHSWYLDRKETRFTAMCSLMDSMGTVWMGGGKGLWYYDDYSQPAQPSSFKHLSHPLIDGSKRIWAVSICRGWLILAANDKMLALDLATFHHSGKIILRYLNPFEANFTSFTEQNTTITARDSTVWFSTSDNLYHWDFRWWLSLPKYKCSVQPVLTLGDTTYSLTGKHTLELEPDRRAFNIQIRIDAADCLPRYYRTALVHEGDTIRWAAINTRDQLSFQDLHSGTYTLHVEVYEQDGTTSAYSYELRIRKHFYQSLWFWGIAGIIAILLIVAYLNILRKRAIADQRAILRAAELEAYKAEQEKRLSDLQVLTLSNQFRPHFILNALNTIGSRMHDRPEIESVLSRLGESISLIFNHSRRQEVMHHLRDEWALVLSLIQIHKLMYLKGLQSSLPNESDLARLGAVQVPMGIMQIPVENALLHGLSNKEDGPWHLKISIVTDGDGTLIITITDDGIGRKKAATLSNATRHGTGTKNQAAIADILNKEGGVKILVAYEDDIYVGEDGPYGTRCVIKVSLQKKNKNNNQEA